LIQTILLDFVFLIQFGKGIEKSFEMLHLIDLKIVSDTSKDHIAAIFRVSQSVSQRGESTILRNVDNYLPAVDMA